MTLFFEIAGKLPGGKGWKWKELGGTAPLIGGLVRITSFQNCHEYLISCPEEKLFLRNERNKKIRNERNKKISISLK